MKRVNLRVLTYSLALTALFAACANDPTASPAGAAQTIEGETDRASYAIGADIGERLKSDGFDVNVDMIVKGLRDAMAGSLEMTTEERTAALNELQQKLMAAQQEKQQMEGAVNAEKGKAYLADNGAKDGVTTTDSGLQYEVVEAGSGAKPTAESNVKVHYRGTLIDGTQFDSSYDRGQPASFRLNQVIPGWTEALQLMSPGAKYRLHIPSELAYGPAGPPGIGANQTLIFDVELLEVLE